MGLLRQSRDERRPDRRRLLLQDRDRQILEALGRMRFLTTVQLGQIFFAGSRSATNKRLRKLLDQRLVRCWVRDLAQDNVYSLGRAGARLLAEAEGDEFDARAPAGLDGTLDHLLAINDIRIAFAVGLLESGGQIAWWRSDWELRAGFKERVVPDALFAVRWDGEEHVLALEVDNETRSPRQFLKKLLGYRALLLRGAGLYGVAVSLILVARRDERWLERYREHASHTGLGSQVAFATLEALRKEGPQGEVWMLADSDRRSSLQALVSLPYSTETWTAGITVNTGG